MGKSLKVEQLDDKAYAWFLEQAERFNAITAGPDIQWIRNAQGRFEVSTTHAITPGRITNCHERLEHSPQVEQSIYCDIYLFHKVKAIYIDGGEKALTNMAQYCRDSYARTGPIDESTIQARRWESTGSMLIISIGTESFVAQIPNCFIHDFIALDTKTEKNVTYLSHLRNTV